MDSEMKVRYFLKLVCVKIREDGSMWDKFLKFFTKIGIQELRESLKATHTQVKPPTIIKAGRPQVGESGVGFRLISLLHHFIVDPTQFQS